MHDPDGHAHSWLGMAGADRSAQYLIRPDGDIAYRAAGTHLEGLEAYLEAWHNCSST
jgi:hypothetical protein